MCSSRDASALSAGLLAAPPCISAGVSHAPATAQAPDNTTDAELRQLFLRIVESAPQEAVRLLAPYPDEFVVDMLALLNPAMAQDLLDCFGDARRQKIFATAPPETTRQWMRNDAYPEQSIGRLMQPPIAVYRPETTIAEATEQIRNLAPKAMVTYGFVVDDTDPCSA